MSTNVDVVESSSDAVFSSEPPTNSDITVSNGVTVVVGDESLHSKTETLATEPASAGVIVQDLVADARVSGGELVTVMDNDELDELSSDAVILSVPTAASNGVNIGDNLLESKTENLKMETSDHDGLGNIVAQDSIIDTKVSRDVTGIVIENSELVFDQSVSEAVVSSVPLINRDTDAVDGVNIAAESLGSKTETLATKPSADQNGDRDISVQDSVDCSKVSGDEKEIVTENIEKVSDENEVHNEEKEGEYKVTDIVWAKVKNHPWWPGQIFDPSSSTDVAKKHSNKKAFLVGYFGDQSFAWNKASKIKPFRKNFCKLEKQSNSKAFFHAVNCALDEVSRRVDFGMACSCLSEEVRDKIKSQVFVNAGIRKEASKIEGGDRFSTISTFKPVKVVQSVQDLAREHFDGFSRLEVLLVRTQLLAFFRWKGYYQFQTQNILDQLDGKLDDESEPPLMEENKVVEDENISSKKRKPDVCDSDDSIPLKKVRSLINPAPKGNSSVKGSIKNISKKDGIKNISKTATIEDEKPSSAGKKVPSRKTKPDVCDSDDSVPRKKELKDNSSVKKSKKNIGKKETVRENVDSDEKQASVGKKVSSKKRKLDVSDRDDLVPRKKERSFPNVTPKRNSNVKRSKKCISKKATNESPSVVKEENGNGIGDKKPSISSPKKLFRVGDSICRIAKQISESPSVVVKKLSQKSKNVQP